MRHCLVGPGPLDHDFPAAEAMDALSMAHGRDAIRRASEAVLGGEPSLALRLGLSLGGRTLPPGFAWERLLAARLPVLTAHERAGALASLAAALRHA